MMSNSTCRWCGEEIKPGEQRSLNVCQPCETKRVWLLRSIRLSDHPAKYVARVEEREGPIRERNAAKVATEKPTVKAESVNSDQDARLRRVEFIVEKLAKEFGL